MVINKKITPYNYTPMIDKKNEFIVIHYVGAVSSAKNNATYYANNQLKASAHYFVDENEIWQAVKDTDKAWHCGGGLQGSAGHAFYQKCTNSNSIGIEMCCKKDANGKWYFEDNTVKNTIELVKYLMNVYNIPAEKVIRHYDVTGKICPEPYIEDAKWSGFKALLKGDADTMTEYERKQFNGFVARLEDFDKRLKEIENPMIYNYVDENMPEFARNTISKLLRKGKLKGDENGLGLNYLMLRILVILDRFGLFGD